MKNNFGSSDANNKDEYIPTSDVDTSTIYTENKAEISIHKNFYLNTVSNNIDVFSQIVSKLDSIENSNIKEFLIKFIRMFQITIIYFINQKQLSNYLPPMRMKQEEDYVFIEWIFPDFRVGFSIDNIIEESSWFLVTNSELEEFTVSGELLPDLNLTITKITQYVLENT